jgi:hypothetical protein
MAQAPTEDYHVGVMGRRRREHPHGSSEEVRPLARGAPCSDAGLQRGLLDGTHRPLEVRGHKHRGVGRGELARDRVAAARHAVFDSDRFDLNFAT